MNWLVWGRLFHQNGKAMIGDSNGRNLCTNVDTWQERLPGRILTVQYEDTVASFETQVRRIVEFCELPWEDACLRFYETDRPVRTASSEQVRQPIYSDSLNFWKRYEDKLGELIEVIQPVRDRYRHLE